MDPELYRAHEERTDMHRNWLRFPAVLAIATIVGAACSSGAPAVTPGGSASGAPAASPTKAGPPVEIRWYCCLGTGEDPAQVPTERKVIAAFNASHPNIKLSIDIVTYDAARDTLATRIASGKGPDIVGPVGFGGAEAFHGQWLDLTPYIQKANYDLSQYSADAVKLYKSGNEQLGLPFATFPSMLYYQPDMFDEAKLEYPPSEYGAKYKMPDGSEVDWTYDTIRQIALKLTVDRAGKDATEAGFNPRQIVQYGFEPQMDDARGTGAYFGAGSLVADDGKTAQIPDAWAAGWKWVYDGIHKDHFIANRAVRQSAEYGEGNPFASGKVAMTTNFLWETCCLEKAGKTWDVAAVPAFNGTTTAALNADTFRILKSSKNPDAAFEVMSYLLGDGSKDLLSVYGGMPARTADQDSFFEGMDKRFPQKPNWDVAKAGIEKADNPNFESYVPAYNKTLDQIIKFWSKVTSTPNLNMDNEIAQLKKDIQAIYDKA
jgi:multiple sugar transport system substrate-binding protein